MCVCACACVCVCMLACMRGCVCVLLGPNHYCRINFILLFSIFKTIIMALIPMIFLLWLQQKSAITEKSGVPFSFVRKVFNCILFQKLAFAAERTDDIDPETIFKHELTTIPKALAETPELLHEAQKSTLADTIWSAVNQNAVSIPDVRFVLDGGALLHRIPWSQGASYESILETYSKYVATNFGKAVVVFDGYKELQPNI